MSTVSAKTIENSLKQYINPNVFLRIVEMGKWLLDKMSKVVKTKK